MVKTVLAIFDFLKKNRVVSWLMLAAMTVVMVLLVVRLNYKEDITDFLPLDEKNQTALSVYQEISGADKVYAIVNAKDTANIDPDLLTEAVDCFAESLQQLDTAGYISSVTTTIDVDKMLEVSDSIYANLPYFLTDADYARIDSLLADRTYLDRQLEEDKQMLMFPSSSILAMNIGRDPLNLFTPVINRLGRGGVEIEYENYDGYILSPDQRRAIVMMESSFGASESDNNGKLVEMLYKAVEKTESQVDGMEVHLIGGPVIAVSNAHRIKTDSMIAIGIAAILIILLLVYVFRNIRNIMLIVVSVGWGFLFALAGLALFYDSVSIIVIGISSVIIGIAVNYPLHLIDHLKDRSQPRAALREIVAPLLIGNITTVGAFLCLVPLSAPALRDLGIFSSFLLVGTILFVLVFLPHAVKVKKGNAKPYEPRLITKLASIKLDNNPRIVWTIVLLTVVLGYFSLHTGFDTDIRNINYMTATQREDMDYFQSLVQNDSKNENVYVVSHGKDWEEALLNAGKMDPVIDSLVSGGKAVRQNQAMSFLKPGSERDRRLQRWHEFKEKYKQLFVFGMVRATSNAGFSRDAFNEFNEILERDYGNKQFDDFQWLTSTVFMGNVSHDRATGRHSMVQVLETAPENVREISDRLSAVAGDDGLVFDVRSMNNSLASTLSEDFNWIGYACGAIVFIFLWISLGSLELALMSFLPMAVSWVWILGLMCMFGIKFNIVNVILATFIFGQGDDYTIFMTEGLSYELAYRKKLLASYKNSIIVSALIMFIGIGTLVFAAHPAMRSLGEVTVVGMLSVVIMAYLFPPLIFNWLVRKDGKLRLHPVTVKMLWMRLRGKDKALLTPGDTMESVRTIVMGRYLYKGLDIERSARKAIKSYCRQSAAIENMNCGATISISDHYGQGELALALALMYPDCKIIVDMAEPEKRQLLESAAVDLIEPERIVATIKGESTDHQPDITVGPDYSI